jgi:hypothetical protein
MYSATTAVGTLHGPALIVDGSDTRRT